jgi:hypothetical protein
MKTSLVSVFFVVLGALAGACTGAVTTGENSAEVGSCGGAPDGSACDDGLFCTVGDTCQSGVCIGKERPCGGDLGFCELATCDEDADQCVAEVRDDCENECATPELESAYQKGWTDGFAAVTEIWDRDDDCDASEEIIADITRQIEEAQQKPGGDTGEARRCRKAGVLDGGYAAIDSIQVFCDEVCFADGELVGAVAAAAYCEMAIDADCGKDAGEWMRGPVNLCGLNYEIGCDGAFIGTSIDYVNEKGACEPYTLGEHEQAWDRTRNVACDYQNRPGQ